MCFAAFLPKFWPFYHPIHAPQTTEGASRPKERRKRGKAASSVFWSSWLLNTSPMTQPTDKAINKSKTLFSSVGPGFYVDFSLAMPSRNFWGMWDPALMFLILLAMTSRNFLSYLQWPPETSAVSETSTRNFSSWLSLTHYVLQKLQQETSPQVYFLLIMLHGNFNKITHGVLQSFNWYPVLMAAS